MKLMLQQFPENAYDGLQRALYFFKTIMLPFPSLTAYLALTFYPCKQIYLNIKKEHEKKREKSNRTAIQSQRSKL